MQFTYKAYKDMCGLLKSNGYAVCNFHDYKEHDKCVILRHDVDLSPGKALDLAMLENGINIKSTYFFLLTSELYNIVSYQNLEIIRNIKELGHEIGLHFDEACYPGKSAQLPGLIEKEARIFSDITGLEIKAVSMHRPSKETLAVNIKLTAAVNTYSSEYISDIKYISDSRRDWHEPVLDIIKSNEYNKLHILTHPFWYTEDGDSASAVIKAFINNAKHERYTSLNDNIRTLNEFIVEDEI